MPKQKNYNNPFLIKETAKFVRIFVFLLLITLVAINWGTIKGMFNYNVVYGDFWNSLKEGFTDFSKKEIADVKNPEVKVPDVMLSKREFEFSEKSDSIEIPKIGVVAPLIFPEGNTEKLLAKALNKGVVFYPDSALPGEEGITVILGHSAPSNWPKINYDGVFTRLNELKPGDEIFIYLNHRKYQYKVTGKLFLKRGDEIPKPDLSESKSFLTLLSCWPPGINNKRIAIQAELQF